MQISSVIEFFLAFFIAILYGTFVEYTMHRLMHAGLVLGDQHAKHHQDGTGKGWFEEFLNYSLPSITVLWFGFLYSTVAGIGFALGGILASAFGAYAHQLQHERPELTFWLARPVHHLHHKHHMWRHNFGISVDFWDRIFGTYKAADWEPDGKSRYPLRSYFSIRWR
ncbi:MAG: sterol desaturase family protein [Gammaproteobacteria bacterium]